MARFKTIAVTGFILGAMSTALAGCADNESMMFIVGVVEVSSSDCVLSPDPEGPFIGMGRLDIAVRDSYVAPILVGNQLTERGSRNQLRTETSRVRLEGAEVTLEDANGSEIAEFTTLGSGFVHPAGGTDPSYGAFFTNLIPPGANLGEGQYVAAIKVFGTTLGGEEVESGTLRFPIEICYGCLIEYPGSAQDINADATQYLCATSSATAAGGEQSLSAGGCYLGQDFPLNCLACAASNEVCRDPSLNPNIGG